MEIVKEIIMYLFVVAPLVAGALGFFWYAYNDERRTRIQYNRTLVAHEEACIALRLYVTGF